jgi:hypothetical protein
MREARRRFGVLKHDAEFENTPYPHVALASDHYALVKRYTAPAPVWKRHLAVWHMRRAVVHAKAAIFVASHPYELSVDQLDVIQTILRKAPGWLGGNVKLAKKIIELALSPSRLDIEEMQPHTRALLLIGLGECELKMGKPMLDVAKHYDEALRFENDIFSEPDTLMAQRQWVRILFAAGIFYLDNCSNNDLKMKGSYCLKRARALAKQVSQDQLEKIEHECAKRGL